MADADKHWDLTSDPAEAAAPTMPAITPVGYSTEPAREALYQVSQSYDPRRDQEVTRGDLARGLLWLLTFAIGGVLVFVGLGRLDGSVITQSIFPSLIALAGTALGFYFGSQTGKADSSTSVNTQPLAFTPAVSSGTSSTSNPAAGATQPNNQGSNG
jgi:hypothetical protein